jgi:hypothetical protein
MTRRRRYRWCYSPCWFSRRVDRAVHRRLPVVLARAAAVLERSGRWQGRLAPLLWTAAGYLRRHSPRWGELSPGWARRVDLRWFVGVQAVAQDQAERTTSR